MNLTSEESDRFWSKVAKAGQDECWPWTAYRNRKGYGQFGLKRDVVPAHRIAYFLVKGPIPDGFQVCHKCDNPPCCNPGHLFTGTNSDNVGDKCAKERQSKGNSHGEKVRAALAAHPERVARGSKSGRYTKPERTAKGEDTGSAKLTDDQVKAMRNEYAVGGVSYSELAVRYGVAKPTVGNIVRGEKWKHLL